MVIPKGILGTPTPSTALPAPPTIAIVTGCFVSPTPEHLIVSCYRPVVAQWSVLGWLA
ncbi:hypothetical protein BP00DRAFT_429498 [Aspergillus indologenus CBS 114.80]|uniref:Uncharacterized protein n=1 Tax=Aspergillus indologenus CBS 114.80 TaxID=1450541 RepID=A0A2V5IFM0_9EURO|nr:hypothetical protein BP00DRAFT_429498 [Aspergillus indologenus CBS 114.80]